MNTKMMKNPHSNMKDSGNRTTLLILSFAVWFIIDTLYFTISEAPFLRARQMWAFVSGVAIANNRNKSKEIIEKAPFLVGSFMLGLFMMFITNTETIKTLPLIVGNF